MDTASPLDNPVKILDVQADKGPKSAWRIALDKFMRDPTGLVGLGILAVVVLAAVIGPAIYPRGPLEMVAAPMLWPGDDPGFPLGTDSLGRDVLAGIVYGARVSLVVSAVAAFIGLILGGLLGGLGGYFGGIVDLLVVRLTEIFQTMPPFVFLIVIVAVAGPSSSTIALGIGMVGWPTIARLVRSEFRSIRNKEFVMAARALGYGHARIALREILPNALPPIIVTASVMVATAILYESAISFIGIGDPNVLSWGAMIGAGREFLRSAWYLAAIPGLAIVLTVLSLNLIGDALNDAFNPRVKRGR